MSTAEKKPSLVKKTPTKDGVGAKAAPAASPAKRPASAPALKKPAVGKEAVPAKPTTPTQTKKAATKTTDSAEKKKPTTTKDAKEVKDIKKKKDGVTPTKTSTTTTKVKKAASKEKDSTKEKDPTKKKKVPKEEVDSPEDTDEDVDHENDEEVVSVPTTPQSTAPPPIVAPITTTPSQIEPPTPTATSPTTPTPTTTPPPPFSDTNKDPAGRLKALLEECQGNPGVLISMYKLFTDFVKQKGLMPDGSEDPLTQLYNSYPSRNGPLSSSLDGHIAAMEANPQFIQSLSEKDKAALRAKAMERIKSIKERNSLVAGGGTENGTKQNGVV